MKRSKSEERHALAFISPAMVIVFGIIIVPVIATFLYSIIDNDMLSSYRGQFRGLHFYIQALASSGFWEDLGRTAYFTVVSTAVEVVAGLLIALLLNEKFPGVKVLRAIVIIPWALPTVVNGSLWKLIFNGEYGVVNEILTRLNIIPSFQSWLGSTRSAMNCIIIADAWKMTPLSVIFFLAALQTVDRSIHEAAMVDGARILKRFYVVTLPELRPTFMVIIIMRIVEKFKAFDVFYLMSRGGPANSTRTLMYDAYLEAFTHLNYSRAATLSYLIAIIVAFLTWVYVRTMNAERT